MNTLRYLDLKCLVILLSRKSISRKTLRTILECTENQLNFMLKKFETEGYIHRIKQGGIFHSQDISIRDRKKVIDIFTDLFGGSGLSVSSFDVKIFGAEQTRKGHEEESNEEDKDTRYEDLISEITESMMEWLYDNEIEVNPTELGKLSTAIAKKVVKLSRK